jgi:inositol phosphorylceramide mannosyltransferase catalytic subunit
MSSREKLSMHSFLKKDAAANISFSNTLCIPRVIWQTSRDKSKIPLPLVNCINRLKDMNPTWEHRLFDDSLQLSELSSVCNDRFMQAYKRIEPRYGAGRADLFRYVMIYLYGGAYFDLKSGTSRPLDDILRPDDSFIISQWDNAPNGLFPGVGFRKSINDIPGGEYQQWFIIAKPGHPFLAAAIERALHNIETYNPYVHGYGGDAVLRLVGPDVYTRGIRSLEKKHAHRFVNSWKDGLIYTMLPDAQSHKKLDANHYGSVDLLPLTSDGLSVLPMLHFEFLKFLHLPVRLFRRWNKKRLLLRRQGRF